MKLFTIFWFIIIILLIGCQPQEVKLTITYDRNPQNTFPYASYGDVAKIYYTVAGKNYEHSVSNHRSIQITVLERTELRATFDKFITDEGGPRSTVEDVYYKVDKDKPVWKF